MSTKRTCMDFSVTGQQCPVLKHHSAPASVLQPPRTSNFDHGIHCRCPNEPDSTGRWSIFSKKGFGLLRSSQLTVGLSASQNLNSPALDSMIFRSLPVSYLPTSPNCLWYLLKGGLVAVARGMFLLHPAVETNSPNSNDSITTHHALLCYPLKSC